jgi:MoxR-like ATPase
MDRFAMELALGYLEPEEEAALLAAQTRTHPLDAVTPAVTPEEVLAIRRAAREVRVSGELRRYMVELVAATRKTAGVRLGASPRASLALMKCCQTLALFEGRDCVTPDHVQELAVPVVAHRLVLDPQAEFSGQNSRDIVEDLLRHTPAPA